MNSVFLSPHFPPNFRHFCARLKECGCTVLGVADEPYDHLSPDLRHSLSEYYRVTDMHNYDELVRALGYFTHRYGKLDHLDSLNEYWLATEAGLRTDFNIPGIKLGDIDKIKRKSEMKRIFAAAGLKPARGRVCHTEQELRDFIAEVGYPVVAKPDIGVGAAKTFKINDDGELARYWQEKPAADYIVEEFIPGQILTYDGLVDAAGEVVFASSLRYSKGVMDAVNENTDLYYYIVREIEPEVEAAGLTTLRAFDVRSRPFHFEFFLGDDGQVTPLEVNMRPPGGLTVDMFNYAFDSDCYRAWAEVVTTGNSKKLDERRYFVIYVGRKDGIAYVRSHQDVLNRYAWLLVHEERINSVFAPAIGDHGYILRAPELAPLIEAAEWIQERGMSS